MREFAQRLAKRTGLTPEAFFRALDSQYSRAVPCSVFKMELQRLNLQLSKAQLARLVLALDEDMEGEITLEEYCNALVVYGCSTEQHSGAAGGQCACRFEQRALFKLLSLLAERHISAQEFFNGCDADRDGVVQLEEMEEYLLSLSADLQQKEIYAVHSFFDLNKDGLCLEKEYKTQMSKAQRLYEAHLLHVKDPRKPGGRPDTAASAGGRPGSLEATTQKGELLLNDQPLSSVIPGYSTMSLEDRNRRVVSYLNEQFALRKLNPLRVYSMADKGRSDQVEFRDVLVALQKLAPDLPAELVDELPNVFEVAYSQLISREDFELLFDVNARE